MPAVSKKQRRFMGGVYAGAIPAPEGLSKAEAKKFASTKEKGLPMRKGKKK